MSFPRDEIAKQVSDCINPDIWDTEKEVEVQTDKDRVKLVPCRECKRPLAVTTFFAPAKAQCSVCKGGNNGNAVASVGVPIPGSTSPAKAVNLADCLVNPTFAFARCPVHPGDDEHVMELKSVSHNDEHGPQELIGYKDGRPQYRRIAIGETVMLQCDTCKATVSYSTTATHQFRRQNEEGPMNVKHVNGFGVLLGTRA